ncbi:mitochondrial substrate carrier family protein [Cavenderia fasciculata]|uniref:Mitochondrial substrate carrier family protein n=1 Tax=Cavenderia fasciculata TaxID=261658 RepID=F4Q133_CACFS|nr:mitochondrial substrate carrier family protein [Cavenderia fasciculata]EGG18534.1 mitochondrial substrate carrier family protein [Cavenderia fasciculata]|eukprot:XP_004366438.1 mitochondrial substrate carrier family protein [Cavenderia fasciculata]
MSSVHVENELNQSSSSTSSTTSTSKQPVYNNNNNNNLFTNAQTTSSPSEHNRHRPTSTSTISWDDMDPKKYYGYNMIFCLAIDGMMYPLDVVRTRLQVQGSSIVAQNFPHYNGTWDGLKSISRLEGYKGFYRGFINCEVGYLSSKMVYFGCYEQSKQYLKNNNFGHTSSYISGALAELSSLAIWVPFDVTTQKCQIQGKTNKYVNAYEIFKQSYNERGVRGLYRGFGATIIRNVPYSAIWWGTYEHSKDILHKIDIRAKLGLPQRSTTQYLAVSENDHEVENEDPVVHMFAGFTSAVISTVLCNPFDVIKTRLQTGSYQSIINNQTTTTTANVSNNATSSSSSSRWSIIRHSHFLQVFTDTIKREGVKALWKGIVPSLITSAPYSMISIIVYEERVMNSGGHSNRCSSVTILIYVQIYYYYYDYTISFNQNQIIIVYVHSLKGCLGVILSSYRLLALQRTCISSGTVYSEEDLICTPISPRDHKTIII